MPTAVIVIGRIKIHLSTVTSTLPLGVVMIEFSNQISHTFPGGSPASVVMHQSFEAGGSTYADPHAIAKMDDSSKKNSNTEFHS